jgi:ATP-dependent RNA helicase DDX24/MAK5
MDSSFPDIKWESFNLHSSIIKSLYSLNFTTPTNIQKKVLAYNTSKSDLVIQARTGEGKTLCYGIPIIDYILKQYDTYPDAVKKISPVAIILSPTRELGIQIKDHLEKIILDIDDSNPDIINVDEKKTKIKKIKIANVMGGFTKLKQIRIINKFNPEIIVATPGRLWELIENDEIKINLGQLKFFIIDEADRMMEKYHFKELKSIVKYLYTQKELFKNGDISKNSALKQRIKDIDDVRNEDIQDEDEFIRKLLKEKGITNAKVENIEMVDLLDHLNEEIIDSGGIILSKSKKKRQKNKLKNDEFNEDDDIEEDENDDEEENKEDQDEEEDEDVDENENEDEEIEIKEENLKKLNKMKNESKIENTKNGKTNKKKKKEDNEKSLIEDLKRNVNLRTILCSATIEIKSKEKSNSKKKENTKKNYEQKTKEKKENEKEKPKEKQALDMLIKNLKFYNKLVYIKLDPEVNMTDENIPDLSSSSYLPSKLKLEAFKCDSDLKDYYLYHLLTLNKDKNIIVFTNSIGHTKKLSSIFSYLDLNIKTLHSKMQQKQRITKLDRFRKSAKTIEKDENGNILFSTDVAARGLDIPEVDIVIHYHIPLTAENFVHRSGRTARAMKGGECYSLVSEKEMNLYKNILRELKIYELTIKTMPLGQLDHYKSLFKAVRDVEKASFLKKKSLRTNEWIKKEADKLEIIPDDNLEEEMNLNMEGTIKDRNLNKEKKKKENKEKLNYIENKKLNERLLQNHIGKSSFLTPSSISQLNSIVYQSGNEKFGKINLSQTLRNAHLDNNVKNKKKKKTRHIKRR